MSGESNMPSDSDLKQELDQVKQDLAVQAATQAGAQATQAATQAGAQATQAATTAGAQATQAAAQAGMAAAIVSGAVAFVVGLFLGLSIHNHNHG